MAENCMEIYYFTTSDSITLYWEKPCDADKNTVYEILVNATKVGETGKTH